MGETPEYTAPQMYKSLQLKRFYRLGGKKSNNLPADPVFYHCCLSFS